MCYTFHLQSFAVCAIIKASGKYERVVAVSYGICRVQKFGRGSVKGIEIHDRREKEGISHTNKDIDWDRTHLNYDLHEPNNDNYIRAVKTRIEQLQLARAPRKDAVVMAQVLVTSDCNYFKGLNKEQQSAFFKDSYRFLCDRYGADNVISATVHLDERTPHMHFNFVPVTKDGRLSAKSIFTKSSLREQQTAFYEQVGKKYGLQRGVEGSTAQHLETAELKLKTAENSLKSTQNALNDVKQGLVRVKGEYEAKNAFLSEIEHNSEAMYPEYAKKSTKGVIKKQEFVTVPADEWEKRYIYANQKQALEEGRKAFDKTISADYQRFMERNIQELKTKNKELHRKNIELDIKLEELQGKFDKLLRAVNQLPQGVINKLNEMLNDDSNTRYRGR